jgi:2-iminobutanoate/2-iminopropanoate deaminase
MTTAAPQPTGPYSQAITAAGLVFVAGQRPQDPVTGQVADGIAAQTRQVLQNVRGVLQAAGCTLAHVVKVAVHLASLHDFDTFNAVYREFFPEPYPARTTVGSSLRGILVEIDVIAITPASREPAASLPDSSPRMPPAS